MVRNLQRVEPSTKNTDARVVSSTLLLPPRVHYVHAVRSTAAFTQVFLGIVGVPWESGGRLYNARNRAVFIRCLRFVCAQDCAKAAPFLFFLFFIFAH